jgi:hypothetical protein
MNTGLLWRLVFSASPRPRTFDCGPWHPDRALVEALAERFRALGHWVEVRSNAGSRGD